MLGLFIGLSLKNKTVGINGNDNMIASINRVL